MQHVEVQVEGQIDQQWSEWLGNLTITHIGRDQTLLTGVVIDQGALYGILTKLRDLGLRLVTVSVDMDRLEFQDNREQKGKDS